MFSVSYDERRVRNIWGERVSLHVLSTIGRRRVAIECRSTGGARIGNGAGRVRSQRGSSLRTGESRGGAAVLSDAAQRSMPVQHEANRCVIAWLRLARSQVCALALAALAERTGLCAVAGAGTSVSAGATPSLGPNAALPACTVVAARLFSGGARSDAPRVRSSRGARRRAWSGGRERRPVTKRRRSRSPSASGSPG